MLNIWYAKLMSASSPNHVACKHVTMLFLTPFVVGVMATSDGVASVDSTEESCYLSRIMTPECPGVSPSRLNLINARWLEV